MTQYDKDGLRLDVPPDWNDRSMIAFTGPAPSGQGGPSIVVTREPMNQEASLRAHADRQLLDLMRQLPEFQASSTRAVTIAGVPAVQMRYTWTSPKGRLAQSMTFIEQMSAGKRIALTLTATANAAEAEAVEPQFEKILQSLSLGPDEEPPADGCRTSPPPRASAPESPLGMYPLPGARHERE